MFGYLPKKTLIFFIPGKSGLVYTYPANHYISADRLINKQDQLVQKTTNPVLYIEDRRKELRHYIPTDLLSNVGRGYQSV